MTITAEATTMTESTLDAERADLLAELAQARFFLRNTASGLTDEQAGRRSTVSELSVLTLIKHVASTEAAWTKFLLGDTSEMSFDLPDGVTWDDLMTGTAREYPQWAIDRQNDFTVLPGDTLAGALERYEEIAARTDEVVRTLPDLSVTYRLPDAPWNQPGEVRSARRVVMHLVSEISQHAGHADIIRESFDGQKSMG